MIAIQIINSGALADYLQTIPQDLPVVIQGVGVEGPYIIHKVEVRAYYRGREGDKTLFVDPATTTQDGRSIVNVLSLE